MVSITGTLSNGFDSTLLMTAVAGNLNHSNIDRKGPVGLIQSSILVGAGLQPAPAQVSWGFTKPAWTSFRDGGFTVSGEATPLGV